VSERPVPEFEVEVRPGFAVTMAALVVVYGVFHVFVSRRIGIPTSLVESLNWGAAVTVLILLGTLMHELGHVAAGLLAGHRWTRAVLNGAGLGVVIEPKPHGWQRIFRSLAGPVVQLLFAVPLLGIAMAGSPSGRLTVLAAETSIWWVAGLGNLFLGVLNLLPVPGFDGAKIVTGVRDLFAESRG
jgi:Zn-dependent protease